MEFTVGMKLTVRGDLEEAEEQGLFKSGAVEEMYEYCLKEVTVVEVPMQGEWCWIREDDCMYFWDKNMFKEFL